MSDEIYRPQRQNVSNNPNMNVPSKDQMIDLPENHPLKHHNQSRNPEYGNLPPGVVTGNVPPGVMGNVPPNVMGNVPPGVMGSIPPQFNMPQGGVSNGFAPLPKSHMDVDTAMVMMNANPELNAILNALKQNNISYEEIMLPSKGKFYDGTDGPTNGIINIRPMTGEEEQILATPRFVKRGNAINMIFNKCIRENINPENLLSEDRTFLLIYLRGISYGTDYEIQIKCPDTEKQFNTTIDLDTLEVKRCPDDFGPNSLSGILPKSELRFSYRLSRGKDDAEVQQYRESKIKAYGETASDDTITFRIAQLINSIGSITNKEELKVLIRSLHIQDVNYMRNIINNPPFGMDTNVSILSPYSNEEFDIDLPLDSGFFFPKNKKAK